MGNPKKGFDFVARRFRKPALTTCVGIGLLLGWMMSVMTRGGVASGPFLGERSLSFDLFYQAIAVVAAVSCLVSCLPSRFLRKALSAHWFVALVCGLSVLAAASTAVIGLVPLSDRMLCFILGACSGVALTVLLTVWLLALASFDPQETIYILLVDIVFAVASFFLVRFVQKILAAPVFTTAVSVTFLLGSLVCLVKMRSLFDDMQVVVAEASPLLTRLAAFAFVASFSVEYASTYAVECGQGFFRGTHEHFFYQAIGALFCVVVVVALIVALRRAGGRDSSVTVLLYRFVVFSLAVGVVLAVYASEAFFAADAVLLLARFLVLVGVWVFALHAVFLYGRDVVGLIGSMLASQFAGLFAGFFICKSVFASFPSSFVPEALLLASLLCVIAAVLFVFTESDAGTTGRIAAQKDEGEATLESRCEAARVRFGLTEREADVLKLLASGRNAVSIQEILCVSYNTVKSHKRSIYSKMGIHSQQELLTLMESF